MQKNKGDLQNLCMDVVSALLQNMRPARNCATQIWRGCSKTAKSIWNYKKTATLLGDCFTCWRLPIFPGRRQPSIFGTIELNFRVRDGNGWTLTVINTNYSVFVGSFFRRSWRLQYIITPFWKMQAFFSNFLKNFLFPEKSPEFGRFPSFQIPFWLFSFVLL